MKQIFTTTLLLILPLTYIKAQHSFRNVDWLMSKADVIAAEKRKPDQVQGNKIVYQNVTAGSFKADLVYSFNKTGLYEGSYIIKTVHSDNSQYYEDYLRLKRTLVAKYGESNDREKWYNSLYKDEPESYGLAAAAGHVFFASSWEKDATKAVLIFTGDNFKPSLAVMYSYRFAVEENATEDTKDF